MVVRAAILVCLLAIAWTSDTNEASPGQQNKVQQYATDMKLVGLQFGFEIDAGSHISLLQTHADMVSPESTAPERVLEQTAISNGPSPPNKTSTTAEQGEHTVNNCSLLSATMRVRVVLTASEFGGQDHKSRLEADLATWAKDKAYPLSEKGCAGFEVTMANEGSAYTEAHGNLTELPGELKPPTEIQSKGRAVSLIHNLLHEFKREPQPDWIFKVDDCVFVIPEHAVALLAKYDAAQPLLLGSQLRTAASPSGDLFASAAGFILSRGALEKLSLWWDDPKLFPQLESMVGDSPDIGLAKLCQHIGIDLPDTRDASGAERFNVFPPLISVTGGFHDWFVDYKKLAGQPVHSGPSCCASDSVLFHYVGGKDVLFLQDLIKGDVFDAQSFSDLLGRWPSKGQSLFDGWNPARPSANPKDLFWELIGSIRQNLLSVVAG